MWPWEHALFAYVFYSLYLRGRYRSRPDDWPVVALVFASMVPDLVDKPLAWQFGVFESGHAAAHSVFVAVPASILIIAVGKRYQREQIGIAFAIGHLLHLVGDVLPVSLSREMVYLAPVLWPVAPNRVIIDRGSFTDGVRTLLSEYVAQLLTLDVTAVIALQIGSVIIGVVLWILDGRPGLVLVKITVWRTIGCKRAD
ncbi:metal-dependent hydrolase [Halobellus marinus]|uniref:metal-dependent hydrolase n=1 Tax=Halobellus TaxID=1073986 RepID=UPI0028A6E7EA|nr:metal-dependent hydrolase [Halobellus sp. DFY28]